MDSGRKFTDQPPERRNGRTDGGWSDQRHDLYRQSAQKCRYPEKAVSLIHGFAGEHGLPLDSDCVCADHRLSVGSGL